MLLTSRDAADDLARTAGGDQFILIVHIIIIPTGQCESCVAPNSPRLDACKRICTESNETKALLLQAPEYMHDSNDPFPIRLKRAYWSTGIPPVESDLRTPLHLHGPPLPTHQPPGRGSPQCVACGNLASSGRPVRQQQRSRSRRGIRVLYQFRRTSIRLPAATCWAPQ